MISATTLSCAFDHVVRQSDCIYDRRFPINCSSSSIITVRLTPYRENTLSFCAPTYTHTLTHKRKGSRSICFEQKKGGERGRASCQACVFDRITNNSRESKKCTQTHTQEKKRLHLKAHFFEASPYCERVSLRSRQQKKEKLSCFLSVVEKCAVDRKTSEVFLAR